MEVKAPNDGILVDKCIQVGDMVAPGMLTMILVDIKIPSLNYRASGYIKAIVPSANPMAHTFKIRVHFEKTNDMIFPGMYAKVFVDLTNEMKDR